MLRNNYDSKLFGSILFRLLNISNPNMEKILWHKLDVKEGNRSQYRRSTITLRGFLILRLLALQLIFTLVLPCHICFCLEEPRVGCFYLRR